MGFVGYCVLLNLLLTMNTYQTSTGERVTKSVIDRKVREAKKMKLQSQIRNRGFNYCEVTGLTRGQYLDCSHIISVDQCQKSGRSEIAWDLDNIQVLCRSEHIRIETMSHDEREALYWEMKKMVSRYY
jgi:hypothetical protein